MRGFGFWKRALRSVPAISMWSGLPVMASRAIAVARCSMPKRSGCRRCCRACSATPGASARCTGSRRRCWCNWSSSVAASLTGNGACVMKIDELIAIDVHTHAEVSCRQEPDEAWKPYEEAAGKYFKAGKRPTIAETIAYYRERKIGLIMFTVDSEFQIGNRRIPNQEVIDAARENSDIMIAFASIDPHKGMMGAREARDLIEGGIVKGFKFHPTCQGFFPNDRLAYKLYE